MHYNKGVLGKLCICGYILSSHFQSFGFAEVPFYTSATKTLLHQQVFLCQVGYSGKKKQHNCRNKYVHKHSQNTQYINSLKIFQISK